MYSRGAQALYLILDQGGHSSRALLVDATGKIQALARCQVSTWHPAAHRVEQDPRELVASLRTAIAEVVDGQGGAIRHQIESAALVTQRSSLVCWRTDTLEPLTPVLSWQDTRAADWLAALDMDPAWVRQKTGLVPSPHYGASKMRWCLDQVQAVAEVRAAGKLVCGPLAAYLAQALTGSDSPSVDPGNASRTLLLNTSTGQWDDELLALFDIPRNILPRVRPTFADYGKLCIGAESIPLELLNGDQCAAFFANGALRADFAYINAGSGAFVAHTLPPRQAVPAGLLVTPVFSSPAEQIYVCEGTVNGAANALDYVASELGIGDYLQLDAWADTVTGVPLFLNGVGGLGAPFWQADFESDFVPDADGSCYSTEQKMVAVLESIVFLLNVNLEIMTTSGLPIRRLVVSGGLATLDSFCRRLATLSGLVVFRPGTLEATARGAAFQLMTALGGDPPGWEPDLGMTFVPEADSGDLGGRYQRWRRFMPRWLSG